MTSPEGDASRQLDLMVAHIEALFSHDRENRLVAVNDAGHDAAPRCFVGRTESSVVCRTRFDVGDDDRDALTAAARAVVVGQSAWADPIDDASFRTILERKAHVGRVWSGPGFGFPPTLPTGADALRVLPDDVDVLRPHFEGWISDVLSGEVVVARLLDGHAVAVCATVRRTNAAGEAGVETAPTFRGRGYAAPCVCEWARVVGAEGRIPLYSTSWTNVASRALARKLGLVQFGSDLHLT